MAIAAVAVVVGLWILVRQSRRKVGSAPLVLAAFPLAVLLLVTPIPLGALWAIGAFQAVGGTGTTPPETLALLLGGLTEPLWWGTAGFTATLVVAALLQRSETQRVAQAMLDAPQEPVPAPAWTSLCIAASVLLVVPAAVLLTLQSNTATLLIDAFVELSVPGQRAVGGMPLDEFSQSLANRVVVSVLGGFALVAAVLVWILGNIAAHRFSAPSEGLQMLSHGVLIVMTLFGLWTLVTLSSNAAAFARLIG